MKIPWWAWALAAIVLIAGLLSPFASSLPDGLESVIEQKEIPVADTEQPAPLPDYGTPGLSSGRAGVFVAAAVGIAIVFVVTYGLGKLVSRRSADESHDAGGGEGATPDPSASAPQQ